MSRNANLCTAICRTAAGFLFVALQFVVAPVRAQQIDIPGPAGSGAFGTKVAVLPNGNIVVTDPNGPVSNVGAVYLYTPAGVLISTLTGSTANDHVGDGGITVLGNGNYVIRSQNWNNGTATKAGAVTWASGNTGIAGVVSAANSLVGTTMNDAVGVGVTALSNGNYVVRSSEWSDGATSRVGAVTWGNGNTGVSGAVSVANSLIGTTAVDLVGGVVALSNGNYIVDSSNWDNGATMDAGAVTWADGSTGISGAVSPANSLVGTANFDSVGIGGVVELSNGNYVVRSNTWRNGALSSAGAATWGNGSTGITGQVTAAISLVGTTAGDGVGGSGITALANGNYVVASGQWDNGGTADAGAATWVDGSTGASGAVSAANSLVGTTVGDKVSSFGVTALSNGNFVVASPFWDNGGMADVGAATWGNGNAGISGVVSAANSLVGTSTSDKVGAIVTALSNGNYVVGSFNWDNGGTVDAGAATWGNGSTGISGAVSASNSLVGTTASDEIASSSIIALNNGNYAVRSPFWDNSATIDAGAVTWGNGSVGISGVVSAANSLIGTTASDIVGIGAAIAVRNGNYVVGSMQWDSGGMANAGAATWLNGSGVVARVVSAANSLIGSTAGDSVGNNGTLTVLSNGDYVVRSTQWHNGSSANAGAVTLGRGRGGTFGPVSAANSVRGTVAGAGSTMVFAYDAVRDTLIVGQPAANIISLFKAELLFETGFE